MAKLYVFGIGGTGARVLRSLSMVLAAGARSKNYNQIVPILIDPDSANGDLTRTIIILKHYQQLQQNNGFFAQELLAFNQLGKTNTLEVEPTFWLPAMKQPNQVFRKFIGLNNMSRTNQEFTKLFFSSKNLDADMEVGFKGNPNIGSVAMNQITQTEGYHEFAKSFQDGDAIFIISSIFGGTGSSGFPLLLKNLRKGDPNITGSDLIKRANIGALTMLPYFKISSFSDSDNKEREIDSGTFMGKAKAALKYYEKGLMNDGSLNSFYLVGDDSQNAYEYNEGSKSQINNAHFLELAAAYAVLDFLEKPQGQNSFREFGINNIDNLQQINLAHLGDNFTKNIGLKLAQFKLLREFQKEGVRVSLRSKTTWTNGKKGFQKDFFQTDFYKILMEFFSNFDKWLDEFADNKISFQPFQSLNDKLILKGDSLKELSYTSFVSSLNKSHNKIAKEFTKESSGHDFLKLFYDAISQQKINH